MGEYVPNDYAWECSRRIPPEFDFEDLLFAMMTRADSLNASKIRAVWPEMWQEMQARRNSPGGRLPEGWEPAPPGPGHTPATAAMIAGLLEEAMGDIAHVTWAPAIIAEIRRRNHGILRAAAIAARERKGLL